MKSVKINANIVGGPMPAAKNWAKEIWEDLSQIDVSEYAVRKGSGGGFNPLYIPWSVVHHILQSKYCGHYTRTDEPLEILPDGTGIVACTVSIRGVEQTAKLAVMDHRFKAIPCDARTVQDAYQRAFVKAAGLHGLGLQLWITGESDPVDLTPRNPKDLYDEARAELEAVVKQAEDSNTSEIDADVLASAKALLEDSSKPTKRMQKASNFIKSQL